MSTKINQDRSLQLAFTAMYMLSDNALLNFVSFDKTDIVEGIQPEFKTNVAISYHLLSEFALRGDDIQWGLELIHLRDISDEDLIEVTKIVRPNMLDYMPDKDGHHRGAMSEWFSSKTGFGMHFPWYLLTKAEHYLRSRGYAVAWNGLTVEAQYRLGWIRFKQPTK